MPREDPEDLAMFEPMGMLPRTPFPRMTADLAPPSDGGYGLLSSTIHEAAHTSLGSPTDSICPKMLPQ